MARYTPNWMQNGVYPAQLDRLLLMDAMGTQNSCLLSGTGAFQVTQHAAGASMILDIAPGRGMVAGNYITNQGNYEIFSDAVDNVTIGTAPGAGQSRIDLVIAQVRDTFVDGGGYNDFIFTTVPGTAANTGSQTAPVAPTDSMTLAQVLVGPNVTSIVNANITDSRPFTRGQTVVQTVPVLAAGQSYTITHNLGTTAIYAQLWDSVTNNLVMTQVTIVDANHIMVTAGAATPNAINAVITGATLSPTPVLASDLAPKAYVDARTPNLPAPVTSGSGVQSFTDALGDVWVAANGVNAGAWKRAREVLKCTIYRNAAFTIGTASATLVYDTVIADDYGMFNISTGVHTAPIPGWWKISYSAGGATTGSNWIQLVPTWANGLYGVAHSSVSGVTVSVQVISLLRFTTAGQTGSIQINGSVSLTGRTSANTTRFEAEYMGTG